MLQLYRLLASVLLVATMACQSPEKKDARVGPPYLTVDIQAVARGSEGARQTAVEVLIRHRLAKRDVFLKTSGASSALVRVRGKDSPVKELVFSISAADLLILNDDRSYSADGTLRYTFVRKLSDAETDPLEGSFVAAVDVRLVLESSAEYTDERPYEIDPVVRDEKAALPIR